MRAAGVNILINADQSFFLFVRDQYYRYKSSLKLLPGSKCPVSRGNLVKWVELAFKTVSEDQQHTRKIAYIFRKCGMDPFDLGKQAFNDHVQSLADKALHKRLLSANTAEN